MVPSWRGLALFVLFVIPGVLGILTMGWTRVKRELCRRPDWLLGKNPLPLTAIADRKKS